MAIDEAVDLDGSIAARTRLGNFACVADDEIIALTDGKFPVRGRARGAAGTRFPDRAR